MPEPLFADVDQTSDNRRNDETHFSFLERCSRQEVVEARLVLERWFSLLPESQSERFRSRLMQESDIEHSATVFELFIHAFLLGTGHTIRRYEPIYGNSQPDFLVETPQNELMVVEATVVERANRNQRTREIHCNAIIDALNEVPGTGHHLRIQFRGEFERSPRTSRVKRGFRHWMSNPSDQFECNEAGMNITVTRFAETSEGYSGPNIGMIIGLEPGGAVHPEQQIRRKLRNKSRQLSAVDIPAVLAIKLPVWSADPYTISQALFGDERVHFSLDSDEVTGTSRADNEALIHRGVPDRTTISGMLCCSKAEPWCVSEASASYWQHPWAVRSFGGDTLNVTRWLPNRSTLEMERFESPSPLSEFL